MVTPIEIVIEPVIAELEAALERGDNGSWLPPWRSMNTMPVRQCGTPYRGANAFLLMLAASVRGYSSPYWFTFNEARKRGWVVRKGSKSVAITFYKKCESKTKTDADGNPETFAVMKYYRVFNAQCIDGVPDHYLAKPEGLPHGAPDATAFDFAQSIGCAISHDGGSAAYYRPSTDSVHLPQREAFKSQEGYDGTVLHEVTHWTGHKSRLDRNMKGGFGSRDYAQEELVAEIGATILCASMGRAYKVEHHASYLEHWHRLLKNNPKALATAAAAAQRAADYCITAYNSQLQAA